MHENSKRAYKSKCKSFKLNKTNAVSVETTAVKLYLSLVRKVLSVVNVQSPSFFLPWIFTIVIIHGKFIII